jgi:hypothetical protein
VFGRLTTHGGHPEFNGHLMVGRSVATDLS